MIAQGISYASDHGARVASISFDNLLSSSSILSAAQYMKSKNGLVVIAAGNCGCSPNLAPSASVIPGVGHRQQRPDDRLVELRQLCRHVGAWGVRSIQPRLAEAMGRSVARHFLAPLLLAR
jgi:hypothetical protein